MKRKEPDSGASPPASPSTSFPALPLPIVWSELAGGAVLSLLYGCPSASSSAACFDLDGTLIEPRSGRAHPRDAGDWMLRFPLSASGVRKRVREHAAGHEVVVFSNQRGVSRGQLPAAALRARVEAVVRALGVPLRAFFAVGDDEHRKPRTGMWRLYLSSRAEGAPEIAPTRSFFVGDAAGRPAAAGRRKDFSCSDRRFALALGLPFETPERHFGAISGEEPFELGFDPRGLAAERWTPEKAAEWAEVAGGSPGVVRLFLAVGPPGCGKSSFHRRHLRADGVEACGRDALGTQARCLSQMTRLVAAGRPVFLDNTSPARQDRRRFVEAAVAALPPKKELRVIFVLMDRERDLAEHMNAFRALTAAGKAVPPVAFATFYKRFEAPEPGEVEMERAEAVVFRAPFEFDPEMLPHADDPEQLERMKKLFCSFLL